MSKYKISRLLRTILNQPRRGSATVLALMVSMLLMILILGTMTLTMMDTRLTMDNARNKKTFQAADSGIRQGRKVLSGALSDWTIPAATTPEDVEQYAADAEAGISGGEDENNTDISVVQDLADRSNEILPRNDWMTSWHTESSENQNDMQVWYDAAYDVWPTQVDYPAAGDFSYRHTFHYDYSITSRGSANISAETNKATRMERGSFSVQVERPNFATYGYFTNSMKNQFDDQLWFFEGEVYGGKTRVNVAPPDGRCAFWGRATFNGPFEAVQATYEESAFGGNPDPQFNGGATWGAEPIQTPQNGWSQLRASIGDYEHIEDQTQPSNNDLRHYLGLPEDGTAVPQGLYYAADSNQGANLTGGLFVNGDATRIKMFTSGAEQVIEIKMNITDGGTFNGEHTWAFYNNEAAGTSRATLDGADAGTFNKNFNGLIHVEGEVLSLIGDGNRDSGDIASNQALTLSVTGDVIVNDDLTYQTNPIDNPAAKNIFGLYSSNGNVLLGRDAPSGLKMHATVMATGDDKGVGAEGITNGGTYDYNYPNKGNWNLLGGLIEDKDQTTGVYYSNGHITGYTWNFTFDERFSSGAAPPYFPYVRKFQVSRGDIVPDNWGRKVY